MLKLLFCLFLFIPLLQAHADFTHSPLGEIRLLEASPQLGTKVSILVYAEQYTGDIPLDTIVEGEFEGSAVLMDRYDQKLWRFKTGILNESKSYRFTAKYFIEDKKQADITRNEIQKLNKQIQKIDSQLQLETDPLILEQLSIEKLDKEESKLMLSDYLSTLRTFLGSEDFYFTPVSSIHY